MAFKDLVDSLLGTVIPCCGEKYGNVFYCHRLGGIAYKINAVFDQEHVFVDADTENVITTNQLVVGVRLRDLRQAALVGDRVKVVGVEYIVKDVQEDGQGGADIIVHIDEEPGNNRNE